MSRSSLILLQRAAGNRAVSQYLTVQRCGSIPPDECPCHSGAEPESDAQVENADAGTDVQIAAVNDVVAGPSLQRWTLGAAPAPNPTWVPVTDPAHVARVGQAQASIAGVLASRNCRNYFSSTCTNAAAANALAQAYDNAIVYHRPVDDNEFGSSITGTSNISYNLRSFRIGRAMMASTLLHEMFHTCDPTVDARDELDAENAVEACRMHTPWIDTVSPRRGGAGTRVTIVGWGFGATRGPADEVQIAGMAAPVISWDFLPDNTSRVRIVVENPAGSGAGAGAGAGSDVVVVNNGVRSNAVPFTLT